MTKVIHLPSRRAGTRVQTPAPFPKQTTGTTDGIARQQAIENTLSMALFFMRQPGNATANVWAATARTNRALTLLKQASQDNGLASPSNTLRRV